MSGWVKLHRSMLEWEWYNDINVCRLFVHLLLKANHSDKKWRGIEIKRGQTLTSLDALSNETGLSVSQIRTSLKKLKSTGEIANKSHTKYRVITVLEYDRFQDSDKQNDKQLADKSQTSDKQVTTNKNVKNVKNEKKKDKDMFPPEAETRPNIPYSKILESYHRLLPNHPSVKVLTDKRKAHIRQTWNNYLDTLEDWEQYFSVGVCESDFLSGKATAVNGRKPWMADFDWLINQNNVVKVSEGKYHE